MRLDKTIDKLCASCHISKAQRHYLKTSPEDKNRTFYILPKVHKDRSTWPNEKVPAGRPIMADVDSESSRISQYIDKLL